MPRNLPPAAPSDEELACRAQLGCEESLEALLRRFQSPLLHFLRQRGPAAESEDLLQETFLLAYRNLHRYRRRWRFAPWIFTIARRVSITHARRRQLPRADEAATHALAPGPDAPQALAAEEHRRRLWSIAARVLSEEEVTALWLHYVEDLPTAEIATVLERSRVAVKVILFRARKRLAPHLAAWQPATERASGTEASLLSSRAENRPLPLEIPDV